MPGLTDSRLAVIKTLIDAAPDGVVRSLDMALSTDTSGGPMAVIRDLVAAEAGERRARAMTFGPVLRLCRAPTDRHDFFPPRTIAALWKALKAQHPDQVAEVLEASASWRNETVEAAPFDAAVASCASGLRAPDGTAFAPVVAILEGADPGAAERFAAYLDLTPLARGAMVNLPDWLGRMTEERAASVRLAFSDAVAIAQDAGPRFFEILISQLDEPWQILRVVSGLMERPSDEYLAGSVLAHIGARLLDEVDQRMESMRNFDPTGGSQAGRALAEDARVIVHALIEFDACIDIKREGPWGARIAKHRRELAQLVELRLGKVEDAVEQALPLRTVKLAGKRMRGAPRLTADPEERHVVKAEAMLAFLDHTRASASDGGYASLRNKVVEKLNDRLDQYAEDLIDELRNQDSELHDRARLYLELCAKFVGFVRDEKAAQIVRRRAAA
jgi:hypothetical protein